MNNSNSRNIWISCAVLTLVACLCIGFATTLGAGVLSYTSMASTPTPTLTRLPVTPWPSATPSTFETTPTGMLSTGELAPYVSNQMDEIQKQVASIRGLQPLYDVPRDILTRSDLRQVVEEDFLKDYTADIVHTDTLLMAALGLINPQMDLLSFYQDLYTEQIAGFYDDEKVAMYVIEGSDFLGTDRQTFAHEYTHALQDMYYDLDGNLKFNDDYCQNHSDSCTAVQALIEGDATWTGDEWIIEDGTDQDFQDLLSAATSYSSPVFDSAPPYISESMMFPYLKGLAFVQALIDREGPSAVDQAFSNPPISSEQILHPELYPSEQPLEVDMPDFSTVLDNEWELFDDDDLGEYTLKLILASGINPATRLPEETAGLAAAGWGGDHYQAFIRKQDDAILLVMNILWDSQTDADEFFEAIDTYGQARWGDPYQYSTGEIRWQTNSQSILFSQTGEQTSWIIAPDEDTLEKVAGLIQFEGQQ